MAKKPMKTEEDFEEPKAGATEETDEEEKEEEKEEEEW